MSYFKLKTTSSIKNELLQLAKESPDNKWMLLRGFNVLPVNSEMLEKDSFIQKLKDRFTLRPGIFKMDPKNFYTFHVDASRQVAINMLLEGPDSYTMFGEKTESVEVTKVDQLVYDDSAYYIFDTSTPHAVLNLSNNTRYLLTLGIVDADYATVKDFCIQHNL